MFLGLPSYLQPMTGCAVVCAAGALFGPMSHPAAGAEIYRCTSKGQVTVQQAPCPVEPAPHPQLAVPAAQGKPAQRESLREAAEARHAEQARIRDESQHGFQDVGPDRARSDRVTSVVVANTSLTQAQVCRAAIGAIMGRDPAIIEVQREVAGVTFLTYLRPNKTRWAHRCSVDGNTISWGNADGRWRNLPADGTVMFIKVDGAIAIRQKFADGSLSTVQFSDASLRK